MKKSDIEQVPDEFSDHQRGGCVWTYAACEECPFAICFKESRRQGVARERHELMWYLYQKGYKPRAIGLVLGASPSTVWDVIREKRND